MIICIYIRKAPVCHERWSLSQLRQEDWLGPSVSDKNDHFFKHLLKQRNPSEWRTMITLSGRSVEAPCEWRKMIIFSGWSVWAPYKSQKRALSLAKKSNRVAKNDHFLRKVGCTPEIRYIKLWMLYLSKGACPEKMFFFCFSFSMSWDSIGLDILLHEILFLVELLPPQFWNWSNTWALARSGHFFIIVSPRGTTTEMVKLFFSELSLTLNGKTVGYDFLIYIDLILVLLCLPYHRTIIALSYWAKGD